MSRTVPYDFQGKLLLNPLVSKLQSNWHSEFGSKQKPGPRLGDYTSVGIRIWLQEMPEELRFPKVMDHPIGRICAYKSKYLYDNESTGNWCVNLSFSTTKKPEELPESIEIKGFFPGNAIRVTKRRKWNPDRISIVDYSTNWFERSSDQVFSDKTLKRSALPGNLSFTYGEVQKDAALAIPRDVEAIEIESLDDSRYAYAMARSSVQQGK
jgi:hypothetical protein